MKYFFSLVICIVSEIIFAQAGDTIRYASFSNTIKTPFNPVGTENTYALKARILPFLLGNGSGISTLFGTEIGFLKRNSFGFQGIFISSHDIQDMVTDLAGVYHESGNRSKFVDRAFLFDYRFYFNLQKFRRQNGLTFYTSCFFKKGQQVESYDENFRNDYIYRKENYNSYGIVIGSILNFKNSEHFGVDLSLGYFRKDKNSSTDYQVGSMIKTINEKAIGTGLRIGLTINYWIFVKKRN
ncbi:hypothetical protein OX283_011090 [Flavobacterium sp. SUN052]|uniref:hypothetical protein n=1 Tax=Flavobacterium sp. SUN052 TaxID=3002441 RepID=UPI00237D651F|nr:hypothetical protein [Flavobacterium sp. SUN052]MEC4005204.1 hypothetical protein [Flavobacterium sp. SUN052]